MSTFHDVAYDDPVGAQQMVDAGRIPGPNAPMPALAHLSLDEHLDGTDDETPEAPTDAAEVDRLLGRLARIRAAKAHDEALAKARALQIGAWLEDRGHVHDNAEAHLLALLQSWHEAMLRDDPKAKSISLPSGTLKSRAHQARIEIVAERDFVGWCEVHRADLLRERVLHSPDKAKVNDELRTAESQVGPVVVDPSTGEPVPGVVPKPAGRSFSVEVNVPEEVGA